MRKISTLLILSALTTLVVSPCRAQNLDTHIQCSEFVNQYVDGVVIKDSFAVLDRKDLPGFCAIQGTIIPSIKFEARFPLTDWNGKYYQSGCGGYCGAVIADKKGFSNTINKALERGYAAITTDAGHTGGLGDAAWAEGNQVAVDLYAHRAIPLTYNAGMRLVKAFYGQQSKLQLFGGCSNGGRMAAVAAQRYPELFDGILGGSGVLNLSQNGGIFGSWVVQSNTGQNGQRILNQRNFAHKLPLLEALVLQQCDGSDGQVDGFISLPRNCVVDIAALPLCSETHGNRCFTAAEKRVMEKWYQGPKDSSGKQLYPGFPPGSERYWLVWFLDTETRVAPGNALGGDYTRYLGFEHGVPENYTALDFDFDLDPARLQAKGRLLNALDPDLSAFRDAGGKFLMWHGWQDPLVLPDQSVGYYESVLEKFGGPTEVDSFLRLFMIPGQGHCWELPSAAPDRFDPIAVLESWVETNQPPKQLNVRSLDTESAGTSATAVCPYPGLPVYLDSADELLRDHCSVEQ